MVETTIVTNKREYCHDIMMWKLIATEILTIENLNLKHLSRDLCLVSFWTASVIKPQIKYCKTTFDSFAACNTRRSKLLHSYNLPRQMVWQGRMRIGSLG